MSADAAGIEADIEAIDNEIQDGVFNTEGDDDMEATEAEPTEQERLESLTKAELKEEIREYNEEHGLSRADEAYLLVGGKKDELVERLMEAPDEPVVEAEEEPEPEPEPEDVRDPEIVGVIEHANIEHREQTHLKLGQLDRNPLNPRHKEDYLDEQFIQFIAREGGVGDTLVVRPTEDVTDEGDTVYVPVSGNRRLHNLGEAVNRGLLDWDPDDAYNYPVGVTIRETSGSETSQQFDELSTLITFNEGQWPLSPVDKYHAVKNMLAIEGVNQTDVADALDTSRQYISKMLKLDDVPEAILDYVHYGFNAERYAKARTPEQLKDAGIPFVELDEPNEDGTTVDIMGIPMNTALAIATMLRKIQSESVSTDEGARKSFEQFIEESDYPWEYRTESGTGVVDAAIHMSASQFKGWLEDAVIHAGLLEVDEPEPTDDGDEGSEPSGGTQTLKLGGGDDSGEDDGGSSMDDDSYGARQREAAEQGDGQTDVNEELAAALEGGDFVFDEDLDLITTLADSLRLDDQFANEAFNFLVNKGFLVEK